MAEKQETQALVKPDEFKAWLVEQIPKLQGLATRHVTPDRLLRLAQLACSRVPKLMECTRSSLMKSFADATLTGLEPNTPLQHAAIIPFYNSQTKTTEAQFMPMYKGLIELVKQAGEVLDVEARVVYAADEFDYAYGLEPYLKHKPARAAERGELVAAYCVALFKSGHKKFVVMEKQDIEKVRASSRSFRQGHGPWVDWPDSMWAKSAVKLICKTLKQTPELAAAIETDDMNDLAANGQAASSGPPVGRVKVLQKTPPSDMPDQAPAQESEPETKTDPKPQTTAAQEAAVGG